jgi:hypothetical protein
MSMVLARTVALAPPSVKLPVRRSTACGGREQGGVVGALANSYLPAAAPAASTAINQQHAVPAEIVRPLRRRFADREQAVVDAILRRRRRRLLPFLDLEDAGTPEPTAKVLRPPHMATGSSPPST